MLEQFSQLAERAATSASRRQFLGQIGRGAMLVAAAAGGLLALPAVARAGRRGDLCNPNYSTSSCVNNVIGGACGNGGKCTVTKGTTDHCYCRDQTPPRR